MAADPYESYYARRREGVVGRGPVSGGGPERGDDIHPKEYVIGVRLGGQAAGLSLFGVGPGAGDE
jgi:hypothetical protein